MALIGKSLVLRFVVVLFIIVFFFFSETGFSL